MHNDTILPPPSTTSMKHRDLDAVLLLLLLCELRQHDPEALDLPPSRWRVVICQYIAKDALKFSSISCSNREVIMKFIDMLAKCKNFVNAMIHAGNGIGGKDRKEVATSIAVVVALPSVEASNDNDGRKECVICKEEMKKGRELPSDDVFAEIQRLWEVVAKMSDSAKFLGIK
ncbi:hypothetical protein KY284_037911 [Solanum tuberosum]|nr:hypothetical protein KY284_037911 [Solanum tuberosum]